MNNQAYTSDLLGIISSLPKESQAGFISSFQLSEKNPVVIFGFSVFLGSFGIDRFLVGDTLLGVLKLITLGGFGIWTLVDWFMIGSRARTKNIEMARQLKTSLAG